MSTLNLIHPAPRFSLPIGRAERTVRWKDGVPWMKYTRVWIDVAKLDAILQLGPFTHVGFRGQNGINGRYQGVEEFMASGKALYMVQVRIHYPNEGSVSHPTI